MCGDRSSLVAVVREEDEAAAGAEPRCVEVQIQSMMTLLIRTSDSFFVAQLNGGHVVSLRSILFTPCSSCSEITLKLCHLDLHNSDERRKTPSHHYYIPES